MKTYPYQTPEGIIELVEQREYDELAELALKLANLRAEDMATIKDQNVLIEKLANALTLITEEYEDRRFQFGDEYLWQKHEGNNPLPTAFAALDAYETIERRTTISNTPKTDEAQFSTGRVSVDFARQLERELNAALTENTAMREAIREAHKIIQVLYMDALDHHKESWPRANEWMEKYAAFAKP